LWTQVVLGAVSTTIFLFAVLSANLGQNTPDPGTGGSLFFAICALLAVYFSVYQAWRYSKIGRALANSNSALRPKRTDTIKTVRLGLLGSLVGLLLSIVAAQAITGALVAKSLNQGQGIAVFNPETFNRLIQPLDMFVVLANTHTITAHFVGIVVSLWLLEESNR